MLTYYSPYYGTWYTKTSYTFNPSWNPWDPQYYWDIRYFGSNGRDVVYTDAGDDAIQTYGGADYIVSGAGDDIVDAGSGYDYVNSGSGDDYIAAGSGDDIVYASSGNDTVLGGSGNDHINGASGDDTIYGGTGNDVIHGGSGNDVIYTGDGADQVWGGDGWDTVVANFSLSGGERQLHGGAGYDLLQLESVTSHNLNLVMDFESGKFGHNGSGFVPKGEFSGFERVYGTNSNDKFYGGDSEEVIYARNGNDIYLDAGGNDRFYAGDGGDQVRVGAGNDIYHGGDGVDYLDLRGIHAHGARIDLKDGHLTRSGSDGPDMIGEDRIYSFETIFAGYNDDVIVMKANADHQIIAGGGDDYVYARLGNDRYSQNSNSGGADVEGQSGTDTLDFSQEWRDIYASNKSASFYHVDGDEDTGLTFSGFERIIGGRGDDHLRRAEGVTFIDGGDGDDYIRATQGEIHGGSGRDGIWLGTGGSAHASGGSGTDTVGFYNRSWAENLHIDLAAGTATAQTEIDGQTQIGTHIIDSFENARGSENDDVLRGDGLANELRGFGGDDEIDGRGGHDKLIGDRGDDTLRGGGGDDWVHGGCGDDLLWGGTGADFFVFEKSDQYGRDDVADFNQAEGDLLRLDGLRGVDGRIIEDILDIDRNADGVIDVDDMFVSNIGEGLRLNFEDRSVLLEGVVELDYAAFIIA